MATRDFVNVIAQSGHETTPGTAVAATAKFGSVAVTIDPKVDTDSITPQGEKFATAVYRKHDYSEGKFDGVPCFTELGTILRWAYGDPAAAVAVGTGAWEHEFTIGSGAPRTVEFGDGTNCASAAGVFVAGIDFAWGRNSGDAKVSGKLIGGLWDDSDTITAGLTAPAAQPIEAGMVSVYVDDSWATLGTTVLSDTLSIAVKLDDLRDADWRLNAALPSIAGSVAKAPKAEIEIVAEATASGRALLAALRSGVTKYVRVEAVGAAVGDTGFNTLLLDFAVKAADHSREDADGVYTVKATLQVVTDSAGHNHTATLTNASETIG